MIEETNNMEKSAENVKKHKQMTGQQSEVFFSWLCSEFGEAAGLRQKMALLGCF